MINNITIRQLLCFDAVVRDGSFQTAAERLQRSQPSVSASVKNLETQLGLALFDRSGYRVALTETGRSFHDRTKNFLHELRRLQSHAEQLAMGEEAELNVVIGDLCPLPKLLRLLRTFFDRYPSTRLNLHFETLAGPAERLFDGDADLILHYIDKANAKLEFVDLGSVQLIPVVAPGFLSFPISAEITQERMRDSVQCVIRDTARHTATPSYYVIDGARSLTVSDQLMKKEVILQGAAWGHMPDFLVAAELRDGRLLSVAGRHLPGKRVELVAARRRDLPHGPIADLLWRYIEGEAASIAESEHR